MKEEIKLLIINRYFYPDISSVPQLLTELAEDLIKKGIDIGVLCSKNSYNGNIKHKSYEEYEKIKIYRVSNIAGRNRGFFIRGMELMTFSVSVFFKSFFIKKPDVIFVLSSPPMIAFVGLLISKLRRVKIVYIIEDLHPDLEIELRIIKKGSFSDKILTFFNKLIVKKVNLIITLGNKMKERILKSYGIENKKIVIIPNWSDGNRIYPIEKEKNPFVKKYNSENKFIVQYSGNMGIGHEFKTILEGIKRLRDKKDIVFQFIGGGVKKNEIREFVKKNNLLNIMILPYQSYEDLKYSLNMADISLISVREGIGGLLLPSKFYGILASGKPFILVGDKNNEIYEFIEKHNIGRYVQENNVDKFCENILLYYNNRDMIVNEGKLLRKLFIDNYDRKKATGKYYNLLKGILK